MERRWDTPRIVWLATRQLLDACRPKPEPLQRRFRGEGEEANSPLLHVLGEHRSGEGLEEKCLFVVCTVHNFGNVVLYLRRVDRETHRMHQRQSCASRATHVCHNLPAYLPTHELFGKKISHRKRNTPVVSYEVRKVGAMVCAAAAVVDQPPFPPSFPRAMEALCGGAGRVHSGPKH